MVEAKPVPEQKEPETAPAQEMEQSKPDKITDENVPVGEAAKDEAVTDVEDKQPMAAKAPEPVPTLYARNLNDKVRIEGKFSSFGESICFLLLYRLLQRCE